MPNRPYIFLFPVFTLFLTNVFTQNLEKDYTFSNRKLDSTFYHYKRQLEIAKKENSSSSLALKHSELGEFYFKVGVFSEAMDQYNKALSRIQDHNDTLLVVINNGIGQVELSLKNHEQAEVYFNEALQESIKLEYARGQAISKGLLGSCFEKKGEYEKALKHQKESLALFDLLKDKRGLSLAYENIGSIYEDLEKYDLANENFNTAYSLVRGEDTTSEVNILNNLGDVHRKKGNYKESLYYTNKALNLAEQLKDKHQLASANKDLSKTFVFLGDYQKAFSFLQKAEGIKEEGFYAQNTNQFNVLQTVYETQKKEARINLLIQENRLSTVKQNILLGLFGTGILTLVCFYFFLLKRRKEKLQIQEYEKRLLRTELEKKVIEEENLQNQIQLKTVALSKYSLHLSQKNKILHDISATLKNIANRKNMDTSEKIKVLSKEIDQNLKHDQDWHEFVNYFSDIHPNFVKKLSTYPKEQLSPAELRLGMLLRLNLNSKEIAAVLRVTPDSIRVARHRLRKKLGIEQKEKLVHFLLGL
jgi:tetratricopeptide (TPR) repeat protein/DNA-binding CsgD family transcriptional regulator